MLFAIVVCALFISGSFGGEYCADETFSAQCSDNEVVFITSAKYGRMNTGLCVKSSLGYLGCHDDVTKMVDGWCSGKPSCEFSIGNNPEFLKLDPCNQLRSYLAASFQCVPVKTNHDCTLSEHILTQDSMYLSSYIADALNCGVRTSPWKIQANPGQTVKITLYDFTSSKRSGSIDCVQLGYVVERGININKTICSSNKRERDTIVYASVSHMVEITLIPEAERRQKGAFLLQYEVEGCPDPNLNDGAYYKREGASVEIGCKLEEKVWHLQCKNNQWVGVVGNCSSNIDADKPTNIETSDYQLPQTLIIALIIGAAILFSSIVLVCGFICMSKNGNLNCCGGNDKNDMASVNYESMRYANHAKPKLPMGTHPDQVMTLHHPGCGTIRNEPTIYRDGSQRGVYMKPQYQDGHDTMTPAEYTSRQPVYPDGTNRRQPENI